MKFASLFSKLLLNCIAVILCFFSVRSLYGQDEDPVQDDFFREDQFYLGVSFMVLQSNQEDFNPKGLSRHFQWGFVRDFPLSASGKWSSGLGLGMSFERYNTNFFRSPEGVNSTQFSIAEDSDSPLFFSVHSFELPLSIRWRSATVDDYAFWRVYGGVSFRWNYYNKIRQDALLLKNSSEIQRLGAVAHLSFGYNTWNFFLAYHLSPFFDQQALSPASIPLELNPLKIGLIFYIL